MGITEENIRLFKEAIAEGWSNKIDKRIAECEEDIDPSPAEERNATKTDAQCAPLRRDETHGFW